MIEVLAGVTVVLSALFGLLAAIGVVRFPDTFTRMQATTKAATLGVGLSMVAAMLVFREPGLIARAAAVVLFVFLTTPVAAHMIARAAYFQRSPLAPETIADELSAAYDLEGHQGPGED